MEQENKKDYMTIPQFAEMVGTSKQNIYNQLKGRLEPFGVIVNGRLHILRSAADHYYSDQPQPIPLNPAAQANLNELNSNQQMQSTETNLDQQENNANQSTVINSDQQQTSKLNAKMIEILQQELAEKDRQLAEKDKQIAELHKLLSQQQQLHLATQTQYQQLLETQKDSSEQEDQPKKKGLFDIFKKK